jgi:hypothetical protein
MTVTGLISSLINKVIKRKRGKESTPVLLMSPSKETILRKTLKSRQVKSLSGFWRMLTLKRKKTRMLAEQKNQETHFGYKKTRISRQPA